MLKTSYEYTKHARGALLTLSAMLCVTFILVVIAFSTPAAAQSGAATRVPPTLLPSNVPPTSVPMGASALAKILVNKDHPHLTIGILFNAKPFAALDDSGQVVGFEADIGRAIAQDWGLSDADQQTLFRQVTRQNEIDLLMNGQIDLLMGKVIHTRAADETLDFSDSIFVNHEVALMLATSPKRDIADLAGQTIGVVAGSAAEQAVAEWQKQTGTQATIKRLSMFDEGIKALAAAQIDALVDDRWSLDARVRGAIAGVKLLTGSFRDEPYAIAMRPHDDNLRILVNRTLQHLAKTDRFAKLYAESFSKADLPPDQYTIPIPWVGLDDDKRAITDFSTDLLLPAQPVLARLSAQKVLRVAGVGNPDATGKYSLLDTFDQALITEMAQRWKVTPQFIPDSAGKGEDMVASGAADLAVGVEPHWGSVDRVDFVGIYATHGYRLMVPVGRTINNFADLLATNRWVGVFANDPAAFPTAEKLAKSAGVLNLKKLEINSDDDIMQDIASQNVNVIFGDSLRLVPYANANPKLAKLTDKQYTSNPIAFAVPRNDSDFRARVDETLQDMAHDGFYQKLWKDQFNVGDPLPIGYWP